MRRARLLGATASGFLLGAVLVNAIPASAQVAVLDATSLLQEGLTLVKETGILSALQTASQIQGFINNGISDFNKAIGLNTYGDTNTLLLQGFTQTANYSKAQVGALQQIADASNTAMARFARDTRNAQIRDEHTASPAHCAAIDGGVSTQSAAVQAFGVGQTIAAVHDMRGEAGLGMPSHFSQAQGVASMAVAHASLYCNADDAAASLCTLSATPDADQRSSSLFGGGLYADQAGVNAAKDYAVNLIQPVAPAALRGDQLASVEGREAGVLRRAYNARMSLAQGLVDETVAMQSPAIPLTPTQTNYLTSMGLPVPASGNGSWLQVLQLEAERRVSDVGWHAALQNMPPAAVDREVALELAMNNYLLFATYRLDLKDATIGAAAFAAETDRGFTVPTAHLSIP